MGTGLPGDDHPGVVLRTGKGGEDIHRRAGERHHPRTGLGVAQFGGVLADVPPPQIEHLAAAAPGERQQPDRGNRHGPSGLAGVERAAAPGQLVGVEEPGDVVPRVSGDAETGVGAALAQAPFLGPEHHRMQDFEGAVGRAGLVPAHRVEPRGHVHGADALQRHPAEGGQDAGLEIDAHGFAP